MEHTPPRFDENLVRKYGTTGPRYTSYPTAVSFHEGFDDVMYRRFVERSNEDLIPRPLSLYLHMPFCQSLCYYCACNKKITQQARHGVDYLVTLDREIEMQGGLFDYDREVIQLHLGGGTPTFFDDGQLSDTIKKLGRHFSLSNEAEREFSIEIDPRTVDRDRLAALAGMGFNRLSIGVQDLDPRVQAAVNREQDEAHTLDLIAAGPEFGFNSVSVDLIYGLPLQTLDSFENTLDAIVTARPGRLSVYNYAHMPDRFRAQRLIRNEDVPPAAERLALMRLTIERLTGAGYEYIGMDHFALPDDDLCKARTDGSLQRNFQGYSTCRACDLVGLGVSAIGRLDGCFSQNLKDIRHWQHTIEVGRLPIWRGLALRKEDRVRATVIEAIMCYGTVDFSEVEHRFDLDFSDFFAPEVEAMKRLRDDGLVEMNEQGIRATAVGRLLLRSIAMVFDEYLAELSRPNGFSRVI